MTPFTDLSLTSRYQYGIIFCFILGMSIYIISDAKIKAALVRIAARSRS